MADLEKVVGNLQILRTWCAVNPRYSKGLDAGDCEKAVGWLDDALELLKAQEPVNYTFNFDGDLVCGGCGERIDGTDNYCRTCGRKVKWDG